MKQLSVDLVRPLARKTAIAATVAAVLLTLGTPLSLYIQTRRAGADEAASYAQRMAHLVRDVVIQQPDLWYYDTPKLASHLHLLVEDPAIMLVVVVDQLGRRVDVPEQPDLDWTPLRWARAPVYRGEEVVAQVWVAVDASRGIMRVLLLTLLAWAMAALLSTGLYVLPVRVVGQAELRITKLLTDLEKARSELAVLNEELEERVENRSLQLAETAEALRESEKKLREVAGRAVEATEQERQRVARELHDSTGQMLTAIRLSLQVLGATIDANDPARGRLSDLEQLVDETIDEVRRIAVDLHPVALDRLSLSEAISELCSGMGSRAGLTIDFQSKDLPEELPTAVEGSAFRLVQECLTNVIRYAGAESVTAELSFVENVLSIVVRDDGRGFDPETIDSGYGLLGMQDRVALLGGTLKIESEIDAGTTITAALPVATLESDRS